MIEKQWVDHLYKYIEIDNDTLKFINHAPIQKMFLRLSKISQLGLASKIFPSAIHTKLEHNLGVYFLADHLINKASLPSDIIRPVPFRIAAIIHGIGHFPFSLATELAMQKAAFSNKGVEDFIEVKVWPVVSRILKNVDSKERKAFTKQILKDRGRINHLYRFFTANLLLENEEGLRRVLSDSSGFSFDELLRCLSLPGHIGFKLLHHIDRLDYILRDMFHLGLIKVDLNLSFYFANLRVANNREIIFPSEWKVLDKLESYAVERIYNEERVKAAEVLYQKVFAKTIFDSEIALADLLEWGDKKLETRIQNYQEEKNHKYKFSECVDQIKRKPEQLLRYTFSQHGEKITSRNLLFVEGRSRSIANSFRKDVTRSINIGLFRGSYPDSFDDISNIRVDLVGFERKELQRFLAETAYYEKCYNKRDKNQIARCIWGNHFDVIDFDRYKVVVKTLFQKMQQAKGFQPVDIIVRGILVSPEWLPEGIAPTELAQMMTTMFKLLETIDRKKEVAHVVDKFVIDMLLTNLETLLTHKGLLSSFGLSSREELLDFVKPLFSKKIRRIKDFNGRALEYYTYLSKICEPEKRGDQIRSWVFPSTRTDRGEIDVWSLYVFAHKKPLLELVECSITTNEIKKLDAVSKLKQKRAIIEGRFQKKVEVKAFFNDEEIL